MGSLYAINVRRLKYCVNNEWMESKAAKYMPVMNPSTGEQIAETPCCAVDEAPSAVEGRGAPFRSGQRRRFPNASNSCFASSS